MEGGGDMPHTCRTCGVNGADLKRAMQVCVCTSGGGGWWGGYVCVRVCSCVCVHV